MIPFVNLRAQHDEVRDDLRRAFEEALDNSAFVGGSSVDRFESEFASFLGARQVVGLANGTDAVRIALLVAGVLPGDAIVTVSHTFIGTTEGASQMNVTPLWTSSSA